MFVTYHTSQSQLCRAPRLLRMVPDVQNDFMASISVSDYSSDSEDDAPIAKRKKSTGAKADSDDFAFKNVLRPPRSTTYTAQALYGAALSRWPFGSF